MKKPVSCIEPVEKGLSLSYFSVLPLRPCPLSSCAQRRQLSTDNTAQYSIAQHSTGQHSTAQYSTVQYTAQYTAQYTVHSTQQQSTVQHSTTQYNTVQHSTQYTAQKHSTTQYNQCSNYRGRCRGFLRHYLLASLALELHDASQPGMVLIPGSSLIPGHPRLFPHLWDISIFVPGLSRHS